MVDPLEAGPEVVVVVDAVGGVVVVSLAFGAVVLVVVVAALVVVVEVDAPVVEVVDVGVAGGAGDGLTKFLTEVPVSAPPKIVDSGFPEISSMAVMNSSARTKTMATVPAMARQENPCGVRRAAVARAGVDVACRRCVAGVSVVAEISRRSVSADGAADDVISIVSGARAPCGPDCPTTSVGADDSSGSTEEAAAPLGPVPPSRRNKVELSGARTATCLTTWWPRSID